MPVRRSAVAFALALALAAPSAHAQQRPTPQAPAEAAVVVPEEAPPGASAQIGFGALIGLLAGIAVVALMVGGS
jgi:hypothetical protein